MRGHTRHTTYPLIITQSPKTCYLLLQPNFSHPDTRIHIQTYVHPYPPYNRASLPSHPLRLLTPWSDLGPANTLGVDGHQGVQRFCDAVIHPHGPKHLTSLCLNSNKKHHRNDACGRSPSFFGTLLHRYWNIDRGSQDSQRDSHPPRCSTGHPSPQLIRFHVVFSPSYLSSALQATG